KLFETNINEVRKIIAVEKIDEDIYKITSKSTTAKSVAIVGITHGEEVAGLHIINEILFRIIEGKLQIDKDLYLILGNRKAYLKNQRYTDTDLNRSYWIESQSDKHEEQRALKIKNAIKNCSYVIDIHQTVEDTLFPFFIAPNSERKIYDWISYIGSDIAIIQREPSDKISTLSSYVCSQNNYGVTLEVGGNGFDTYQIALGTKIAENIINSADKQFFQISKNRQRAQIYKIDYHEDYDEGEVIFSKKFVNFEKIKKGQIIALKDNKEITAPISGQIVLYPSSWFKKDSTTAPEGIFIIVNHKKN
ncbi:MAG: succinylglutamate desuccinylase/aspartoacylase family protein, partial [Pseudomonadota bacterium]